MLCTPPCIAQGCGGTHPLRLETTHSLSCSHSQLLLPPAGIPSLAYPVLSWSQGMAPRGREHVEPCYQAVLAQLPRGHIMGAQAPVYPSPPGLEGAESSAFMGSYPLHPSGMWAQAAQAPAVWGLAATAGAWHTRGAQDMLVGSLNPPGSCRTRNMSGLCSAPRLPAPLPSSLALH